MRRYETIVIIDPDLSSEARDPLFKRLKDLITEMEGFFIALEEWGAKKLAYEIKKKQRGYYARFDFCGSGALVHELERIFQIDDRVLKYITVLLDKTPDIDHIKEELAEAAEAAEAAKTAAEAAAEMDAPSSEDTPEGEPEVETAEPETDPGEKTEQE